MFFDLRKEHLRQHSGFAFDIGGSCAKVAYIEESRSDADTVRVCFESFHRDDVEGIAAFLKSKYGDISNDSPKEVYGAGFGAFKHKEKLETMLNIKLVIKNELDGFAKATTHILQHQPREVAFCRTPPGVTEEVQRVLDAFAESPFTKLGESDVQQSSDRPKVQELNLVDSDKKEECVPCLVCMTGSGTGIYTIDKQGKFSLTDGSLSGGRWFVNLCKLVLGTDNFEEIMKLAESGDQRNVDLFGDHIKRDINTDIPEAKIYTSFPDDVVLFFLGKVADYDGDDFSVFEKEDIAASLLQAQVFNIAQLAQIVAKKKGMDKIFFCGGFLSHPYTARKMEEAILFRLHTDMNQESMQYGFMNNGVYYGALGLLLK